LTSVTEQEVLDEFGLREATPNDLKHGARGFLHWEPNSVLNEVEIVENEGGHFACLVIYGYATTTRGTPRALQIEGERVRCGVPGHMATLLVPTQVPAPSQ
jgi:hypothetical protein